MKIWTISDSHMKHRQLKVPDDQVCNQCHTPTVYRSESHHFHKADKKEAVSCLDCHMSATTFMGVDENFGMLLRIGDETRLIPMTTCLETGEI